MPHFASLYREPVEVFQAAIGETEPLAQLLESPEKLTRFDRIALAAFVRGELQRPKLKRGQKYFPHLPDFKENLQGLLLSRAVDEYRFWMAEISQTHGSNYGRKEEVLEYVASLYDVGINSLNNKITRSNPRKKEEKISSIAYHFHVWLHRNGHIENYFDFANIRFAAMLSVAARRSSQDD